jgi:UDP-N-acetylglucosamine 4-epimerase
MTRYDDVKSEIARQRAVWLVTGGAGFIGSHLVEALLALGQDVRVLDNFATGNKRNLFAQAELIEGDLADADACARACKGVTYVLHQGALGSVPRSLADPLSSHRANVDGFVNIMLAARDAQVKRVVYASSSSVYGDHAALPKVEHQLGKPLSPYAATKLIDEIYARTFQDAYGLESIGLRYFNVFGARQDPDGPYAAVIPRFVASLLKGEPCTIYGDGETSRDFCYVANAVQANLLAALAPSSSSNEAYNVACGERTTLSAIFALVRDGLAALPDVVSTRPTLAHEKPLYGPFRDGDVRHSLADIDKARSKLGYLPTHDVVTGLREALSWYVADALRFK